MHYLQSSLFLRSPTISHAFGMAGFSLTDYLNSLGLFDARFFNTNQLHGDKIVSLDGNDSKRIIEADAFVTNKRGVVCYVRTADCVPILMHDPRVGAIAAIHAGWRGTLARISSKVVDYFIDNFGSKRGDIQAVIGPSIGGSCYEVGGDVFKQFIESSVIASRALNSLSASAKQSPKLDLAAINRSILLDAGLKEVEVIPICSHCDTRFASYRRDKTEAARQVNFILLI